jgi:hypothetical protein
MAPRLLRCAIEEIAGWHADLFVEPHVIAFVAVAGRTRDGYGGYGGYGDSLRIHLDGNCLRRYSLWAVWLEPTKVDVPRIPLNGARRISGGGRRTGNTS